MFDMKRATLFLTAFLFSMTAFTQKLHTVFFDLNDDTTESGAAFGIKTTKIVGCTYVGKSSFRNVPNHVFGEIAGAGEPETLTSPWGLSMNYKIENCTYKKK